MLNLIQSYFHIMWCNGEKMLSYGNRGRLNYRLIYYYINKYISDRPAQLETVRSSMAMSLV